MLPRFLAAADSALVVELGDEVSAATTAAVLDLEARLRAAPPAGVLEVLPALRSVLVEYDALRTSHVRLRGDIVALLAHDRVAAAPSAVPAPRAHSVAVRYDGPDLDSVATACGLDRDDVVRLHTAPDYRVAMLGNLPGLPYLLGLDARLRVPRRDDPREAVPPGSVAVAGDLSCVYPAGGPGGWNLVGHTDARLFDPLREPPALLAPGDTVRFVTTDVAAQVAAEHDDNSATRVASATAADDHTAADDAPALHVEDPGTLTTVQDAGRRGLQRIGVPVGGALDAELLHIANLLVGNPDGTAALEVTHSGPTLLVQASSVRLAVAGWCQATRIDARGAASPLHPWRSVVLRRGERLRLGRVQPWLRCVVAVEGGVAVDPVLGSRSTYLRGGFGGVQGRALRRGDVLPLARDYAGHHPDVRLDHATLHDAGLARGGDAPGHALPVRAVPGPQDDAVDPASLAALFTTEAAVSPRSDRVGLRLDGLRLRHRGAAEVVSDGCAPGSVQVPGGGTPIVLLADRGTTGGYPKVATVATVDLPRLARLRPGDRLRLTEVSVEQAESLLRTRHTQLAALADALDTAGGA